MDWTQAVDIYCERTDASFWAEPLNAISNAMFLLAALWAARTAVAQNRREADLWILITLAGLIGIGSFLFHTFAQVWSAFADTIPIWSFVAVFVFVAIRRIGGVNPGKLTIIFLAIAAVITVVVLAASDGSAPELTEPRRDPLNGSGQYAPAVIALIVFSILSWRRSSPMAPWVIAATLAFFVSLCARTVDMAVCNSFPAGTHFIWHGLNGVRIAMLLQGLIRTLDASDPT
ncbi:MAG: ceramidase domain-containing protein [Planktotalea arctica]